MINLDLIVGARPNFIKIAPIIKALKKKNIEENVFTWRLIHTGQHYDVNMSETFFRQLEIPQPDFNLNVGSGSQAEQTAGIMSGYEKLLMLRKPDLCIVVGDVNSTMACAITARKMLVPVAHVEGGIRSGDQTMPEEINRIVTDSITNWFFTTSEIANTNLKNSGVNESGIFFVGNTMIDTLLTFREHFIKPDVWDTLQLKEKEYFVITLHRPANVDEGRKLKLLLDEIVNHTHDLDLIFPVHPRTNKILTELGIKNTRLYLIEPLGYLEFNYLVERSKAVITDSGGITEETTVMGVPCMTLRDTTERPETVHIGTNELIGTDPAKLRPALDRLFEGKWKIGRIPEKWDGGTGERIVNILEKTLTST